VTRTIQVAPVRRSVTVKADAARAFEVFAAKVGAWWPASHHIGQTPVKDVVIEPRVGGRWYEIGEDGAECDWGHVIAWEPPERLLLAWQLGADWRFDAELVTEVEVRFIADGTGSTRVELEHRKLERMGERAAEVAASVGSPGGWSGILEAFAKEAGG
jgi:uncharacterized protein YndB with AHSA1/START domain